MEKVVITRHKSLVEYLAKIGLIEDGVAVLDHATIDNVKGNHVIGILPNHLACHAEMITEIPLALTPDMRGKELTLAEIEQIASEPRNYKVTLI